MVLERKGNEQYIRIDMEVRKIHVSLLKFGTVLATCEAMNKIMASKRLKIHKYPVNLT